MLATLLGASLLLTGCTAAPGATGGAPTAAATASGPTAPPTPVALPDTPLGEHVEWVLAALNGDTPAEDVRAEATDRFSREALDQITPDELARVFEQLASQGPWTPTAVQDAGTQAVVTIAPTTGDKLDLQIALGSGDRIETLLFAPSAADRVPAASWDELEQAVDDFPAATRLVVTEVGPLESGADAAGSPRASDPLFAAGETPGEPMPSGSMFKLYVLGAVADAVAAGTLTWNMPLTVTDDIKSLPSGELQNEPSGTTVTVREAAEAMISISDNTATDLLIATVGPEAVERAFRDLGQGDPSLNTPLLTTRALFQLGWGTSEAEQRGREAWADADEAERRSALAALPTGLVEVEAGDVTTPVWSEGLDWFTTADDLTAVHLALQERAATEAGSPVREILAVNPGLGPDVFGDDWSYVAFKGGSSVGVLAGSWYLERADGKAFTVSIQGESDDPAAVADQAGFFGQVQDAIALLAGE